MSLRLATLRFPRLRVVHLLTLLALHLAPPSPALDWNSGTGFRSASLAVPAASSNGFVSIPSTVSAVTFTNSLPIDRYTTNQIYLNGSGVCAGDIDGDGWTDLFFAGLGGQSALYRNRGNWRFEDFTATSGLAALCQSLDATGSVFADTDGDGDLDLVVNSTRGGTHGFINDGQGHFQRSLLVNPNRGGTSLALADIDGDGDLDLYVANYRTETLRDQPRTNFRIAKTNGQFIVSLVNNRPTTLPELQGRFAYLASGSIVENGEPDALFLNQGNNQFTTVSFTDGAFLDEAGKPLTLPPYDWGLSVLLRDLTGDGQPDLYVCNDFASVDRFWINQGAGRFRLAPALALRNTSKFSMGVDAADINRDGIDDLYVLDMMSRDHGVRLTRMDASMEMRPMGAYDHRPQLARSTLQLGRGDGTFAEIAQFAGLEASEWAWNPLFLDIDLDGFEDLLVATGHARDDMHIDYGSRIEAMRKSARMSTQDELALRKGTPSIATPCLAYRNLGNLHFEEIPNGWGWGDRKTVSQGACLADLDNDGDLDVAVNRLNDTAGLYRNQGSAPRIAVRLKGLAPNSRGIGARITLQGSSGMPQSQEMICGGRYLSGDDSLRVFAAPSIGPATTAGPLRLEVRWRTGHRSILNDVRPNHVYEIDEAQAAPKPPTETPPPTPPLFADESARLGYRHYESPFDDFERQPLLPRRHSQSGPGVAWLDLNGDGRDDLFIASGKGGRPGVFLNSGNGGFQLVEPGPSSVDQCSVVSAPSGERGNVAWVASTAYENPEAGGAGLVAYDAAGTRTEILPLAGTSIGPIALADVDADGDLDLFIGGGPIGGRYPMASPSRFFERVGETWKASPTQDAALAHVDLVSGAVWSDLDDDGFPDLALACEWGPIRVFQNQRGLLREITSEQKLLPGTGWWTGIQSGDFDNDGRQDLVVGNWGENSRYRPNREHPVRLYYGDLAGQGQIELIEASFEPSLAEWAPQRDLTSMAKQLPWLREMFPNHAAYARARVDDLLAGRGVTPQVLEASTLTSILLLHRGDHFEAVPLPPEAQLAPVFGISVADFNLDGNLDLVLAQNCFGLNPSVSGQDAGRGLLLLGNGRGGFSPQSGARSGIQAYGEQRGSAVADYDNDGRPDLLITQNAAEARLYRNTATASGLQIRVRGSAKNPHGIGTTLRVLDGTMPTGPSQVIHAGSGYRSQDAPSFFLRRPTGPLTVEVRSPEGTLSRHVLNPGPTETVVTVPLPPPGPKP